MVQTRNKVLANKFCKCVKKVRRTVTLRKGSGDRARESAAIAICTKSVLRTRGKTLRKFSCKKHIKLETKTFKNRS
jgi:hypothetical protein